MKIIEKIVIKHFRSFDGGVKQPKVEVIDLRDLNIFSGANDSGKSNILRALNLFFNDEVTPGIKFDINRDLSKVLKARSDAKAQSKRKAAPKTDVRQKDLWVKIKIHFYNDKKGVLPERFFVEKTWDKNGLHPKRNSDVKKHKHKYQHVQEGRLTMFLNNIQYEYIPAVKDRQFFNFLFQKLQKHLFEKEDKKEQNVFKTHSSKFNDLLKDQTIKLFEEFRSNTSIQARFSIPDTLLDFFRTLGVTTDNEVSLFDRGDGIQARFIPDILNEISRNSRKKIIWGFEEPENSYEPLRCFELAQDFVKYAEKKQIFITSHAFPFISLQGENISSYRVKIEKNVSQIGLINWEQRTIKGPEFENDTDELEKEVGILEMYSKLSEHLGHELKKQKHTVFIEDTKKEIYKIAWLKINEIACNKDNFEKLFQEKSHFHIYGKGGRDELQKFLDLANMEEYKNSGVIGIFDFDDGFNNFNGLNKIRWKEIEGNKNDCLFRKRKNYNCFYSLLIPVPPSRNDYADSTYTHSYLTLEHLFEDSVLTSIKAHGGEYEPSGGKKIVKINAKGTLWKKLFKLNKADFENFEPLFKKINELFNHE